MSDINENSTMSTEQKFLGVKAKIGTKPDEVVEPEGEIDIEIIDDVEAKPEKKEKVFAEDSKENEVDGNVNEEIINVDKGVQKRIDQLTAKHHEERRQKEQASKLRDEAIIYAQRVLNIPDNKFNVNGGCIALGHPMGATGSIMLSSLLDEMERQDLSTGIVSTSGAAGAGTAILIER